jgi:hypothetical protein
MDDFTNTLNRLDDHVGEAIAADPLAALTMIGQLQRTVADHQRSAVRAAAGRHSWTEIGDALGVTKQAAHQKFAKEWAQTLREELKAEQKTFKTAMKTGDLRRAADAKDRRDAVVGEFKQVHRRARPR